MKMFKRSMAMLLVLCMLVGVVPMNTFANNTDGAESTITESVEKSEEDSEEVEDETTKEDSKEVEDETAKEDSEEVEDESTKEDSEVEETEKEDSQEVKEVNTSAVKKTKMLGKQARTLGVKQVELTYADEYRILHLDCGRKYFTPEWIKALINEMAEAGYTHLELAFGNDGLRFLLNDMSVGNYTDEQVTAAIQQGNRNYHDFGTNELTQSEMDAIIAHADSQGIKVLPLLNNPGHMNAIVTAASSLTGTTAGFAGSSSTVDLENKAAVTFVKGLIGKYIAYFDSKGCNEFNFGADEYANDVYSGGSMGFGQLVSEGKYQLYVDYVNEIAGMIKSYGMVPVAFNDGIYFNQDTSYNFDKQVMVAFWTSGWSGYQSASAATMESLGHKMINVHGDYYYVLGKNDNWDSNGYTYASNWNNNTFMGSDVSDPMGSMFCIWCDYPDAETETQIAANTRTVLRAMAAEMQGKDANSVSNEVIPGGFNADGTIAENCNNVTVKHETTTIEVTGCDLTDVNVIVMENKPAIADATDVLAWDITPYVSDEKYTDAGIVKLPVPAVWNPTLVRGFYMEDEEVILVEGTYENGFYTFKMPHFSVGGILQRDANAPAKTIELNVGESTTELIEGANLTDQNFTPNPSGIASVTAEVYSVEGNKTLVTVESMNDIVSGGKYLITTPSGAILTADNGSYYNNKKLLALKNGSVDVNNTNVWTITSNGNGYTISSGADSYLTFDTNTASVGNTATNITIKHNNNGFNFQTNGDYLNNFGDAGVAAGGWNKYDYNADWYLYRIDGKDTAGGTKVTFTGDAAGKATVTINDTVYKIIVHGTKEITIKYVDGANKIIKTETATVADNATTYAVSNFNHGGKFYTVADTTLDITPATVIEYTVTVTETAEDLSQVDHLEIEYWQTNAVAVENRNSNVSSKQISAEAAYSADGIALTGIIPVTAYKQDGSAGDPALGYWRSRLLLRSTNEQTGADGDDETLNGIGFTKVRYWNGSWAVYTDNGEWMKVNTTDYQLVAYYMNDMDLADEVSVSTSDWGKKGNGDFSGTYLGRANVSLAFQVVYEGGTTAPVGTGIELAPYTYFVDHWRNRGVGTVAINQIGDYRIWKITAETGQHDINYIDKFQPVHVNGFTWDRNEMTVWEDAENPVSHYTIQNPSGNPETTGYYDNLRWDEEKESILIRIYVKAVETEDSLKVVYYDEKFNDTLVEYNVIVPDGSNFNNGIVKANTQTSAILPPFKGNAERKDATGYGIVNALNKTQNFRTDLTQVPEAVGKYNNGLYTYTGSVVSEDGKTITHYYTIDTETLSPNFVVDFGLPLTFPLSKVIGQDQETFVESVSVNQKTKYGTLSYDANEEIFTYTPTTILKNIDVLSINIKFTNEAAAQLTNVGVTPATTVYYEESFLNWESGWSGGNAPIKVGNQTAEVLNHKQYNYGYDPAYATTTGASNGTNATTSTIGAKATFEFTGDGIQIFANCTDESGYVAVEVRRKSDNKAIKLAMVDTVVKGGTTDATTGQKENMFGLPIVSLIDLQNMEHDTYTVKITKIMDTKPVSIDGIRVFNTMKDSTIFTKDLEDKPDFYEMRDMVLHAIGVKGDTSVDYKTMYEQVYDEIEGASALITDESVSYGNTNTIQDLLDNGPKNELFLYADQTLSFKVSTNRVMQLGMKAPQGDILVSVSVDDETEAETKVIDINSSVDMFYTLTDKANSKTTYTVQITNTDSEILSITELKICDDPNAAFVPFTADDIEMILCGRKTEEKPVKPENPSEPEAVVTPESAEKPEGIKKPGTSTITEGAKEDTKESESSLIPTEIVKTEVADSAETSKVVQKENTSVPSKSDEAADNEETVKSETIVEEEAKETEETETSIQDNEIVEIEENEKSDSNPVVLIGAAAAILVAVIAMIFGFKKTTKKK